MLKTVLLVFTTLCCFGCGVRAPMTQFKGASISQSTPEAIALQVEFDVSNTNDTPLHMVMYEYTVEANGRTVYRGKASAEISVPRWSIVSSFLPVVIRRDDIFSSDEVAWQLSGTLGYVATNAMSETLYKSGLWKTTTPVRAHGSITVPPVD